jgi:hypothetical protein
MRRWLKQRRGVRSDYGDSRLTRYDGGTDAQGRTYRPVWDRLAEFAAGAGIDLADYLADAFDSSGPHAPTPWQLCSEHVLAAYRGRLDRDGPSDTDYAIAAQYAELRGRVAALGEHCRVRGLDQLWAVEVTLRDLTNQLTPLFRYCVACDAGLDDVAEAAFDAALAECRRLSPRSLATWGPHMPARLRRAAGVEVGP